MTKTFTLFLFSLFFFTNTFSQNRFLTGTVKDTTGASIPGVSILLKGTDNGTSTDGLGGFRLVVPQNAVLIVRAIGFITQEVSMGSGVNLNIVLKVSNTNLSDVVVTALGVKREKRTLTYSTQSVSGRELVDAKQDNLINSLAGKIAGVQITNSSGMPGSSSQIIIRGNSTIFGDNTALLVIDGVPVDNSEIGNPDGAGSSGGTTNQGSGIDPNIIESINILKGAAATALYGSAGSRGVVLITTKNGKKNNGKPVVTFSTSYSFDSPILPKFQDEYAQGINGQFINGNIEGNYSSYSWGPRIDTLKVNGKQVQTRDNVKDFFKTGHTTDNNFTVSGANDNSSYYISYSYLRTDGTEPTTNYIRNTFFSKYITHLDTDLVLTTQVNLISVQNHRLLEGGNLSNPLYTVYGAPISWDPFPMTNPDGSQQVYRLDRNNPYWITENSGLQDNTYRVVPAINLIYTPLPWLSITERLGGDFHINTTDYHENVGTIGGDGLGRLYTRYAGLSQYNNDLIVEAKKNLNKDLTLDAIVGNNIYSNFENNNIDFGYDLSVPGFYKISNASTVTAGSGSILRRKLGFYAQTNLEYKRMLTLGLTGRYDGTSVLSVGHQFYPYGSASGGFIFTEPLGISQSDFDYGKIRVSYSVVGNDDVDAYYLTNPYYQANGFPINGQNGFQLTTNTAYALKNETIKEFETGMETRFFKDRLSLDVTYYNKISSDLLSPGTPVVPSTGFNSATINSGSIRNRGIEIVLGGTAIKSRDFSWNVNINFTKNTNEVLSLAPGIPYLQTGGYGTPGIYAFAGQPYGVIYGTHYLRNPQGQLLLDDNGYPQPDYNPAPLGNVTPKFIAGMTNTFKYSSFTFSFVLDWKHGGDILNIDDYYLIYYGRLAVTDDRNTTKVFPGIIQSTGKVNTIAVPLNQDYYRNIATQVDETDVEDGSYLKLRQATLAYDFGNFLTGKTIKKLSISLTATNFILHKNYLGSDPEVSLNGSGNGQGYANFVAPSNSSIIIGLKATL